MPKDCTEVFKLNQFMIGQYGGFDYQKYHRDFRDGFYGIEACLFATAKDCATLLAESKNRGFRIGIHFPFRSNASRLRDALFLSPDHAIREEAFTHIEEELGFVAPFQPDYVLFHFPKPVILDDRVNWDKWRFADPSEYIFESTYSFEEFVDKSEYLFMWLTEKSRQYQFVPVLELDALNRYVYETDILEQLLEKYPSIKLCLDTGRLFLQENIDPNFDAKNILRKYGKYAYSIHLWTVQIKDGIHHVRHPVLPELRPKDGWAPIEDYLQIIREENNSVKIMFEHRSDLIREEQLDQCYAWVDSMLDP